ncbi:hypothetical protein BU24DRAFT_425474 [Aaosphaeria arxii CBS 175.79]|uniref:Secreted protein n=1 Tax=Aaosphaeria arxii CBS 175.79 TaxID=1450172 RepID=A0A6A5XJE3_9PLEO|nr:uncharacterized protein BU24DRAFT_425474 [Aaosphaeria arxii CBS 175.79]KAF2012870.1 hypothetical protein BU24DRAFT_425474 [Aaosphaeria arxii CBS 175.79]
MLMLLLLLLVLLALHTWYECTVSAAICICICLCLFSLCMSEWVTRIGRCLAYLAHRSKDATVHPIVLSNSQSQSSAQQSGRGGWQ